MFPEFSVTIPSFTLGCSMPTSLYCATVVKAEIIMNILKGGKGPKTDVAILNAGAAIYIGEKAASILEGVDIARKTVESGDALNTLEKVIKCTNS